MAKIKVLGASFTLTSGLKAADIKKMEKFTKQALSMRDAETKDVIFAIGTGKTPSLSGYGVTFDESNAEGFAQITMSIPTGTADKAAYVQDNFGMALMSLNKLETFVEAQLDNLNTEFATVAESITLVD